MKAMNEHVTLAAVGANIGLVGVHSLLAKLSPILSFVLLILQVSVAALTAWFLYKKVQEVDRKQKFYERRDTTGRKPKKGRSRQTVAKNVAKRVAAVLLIASTIFLLGGCMPAKVPGGSVQTPLAIQHQSASPKESSTLATSSEKTIDFILPAGSMIENPKDGVRFSTSSNTPVRITNRDIVNSEIGAADMTIGKMIAKLQSLKWVQGVGIIVFLFGIATFAYPPLRLLIGSATTSIVIAVCGLGLIVLPTLLVGHEVLILAGCAGIALAYIFIYRYGKTSGEAKALKVWYDDNKNGKVDPGEVR